MSAGLWLWECWENTEISETDEFNGGGQAAGNAVQRQRQKEKG